MGEEAVGSGMVQGGWGYVWMAYGLSWATLLSYAVFALRARARALRAGR